LAREVRRIDPPRTWILDTSVMDSGRVSKQALVGNGRAESPYLVGRACSG
jgi:hypothetical protein